MKWVKHQLDHHKRNWKNYKIRQIKNLNHKIKTKEFTLKHLLYLIYSATTKNKQMHNKKKHLLISISSLRRWKM